MGGRLNREGIYICMGFPGSSAGKEPTCNEGDPGLIPELGRSPGEGNGNLLHYSCLGKIPWTEEPGELQSMGLQRVGHTEQLFVTLWIVANQTPQYMGILQASILERVAMPSCSRPSQPRD